MTSDGGKTWFIDNESKIFGTYFFLSNDLVEHHRNVYNIINLLAEFGGVWGLVFALYKLIGSTINRKLITAKFINELYFFLDPDLSKR